MSHNALEFHCIIKYTPHGLVNLQQSLGRLLSLAQCFITLERVYVNVLKEEDL